MKSVFLLFFVSLSLFVSACDFAGLLGDEHRSQNGVADSDTLLFVEITGGVGGVFQQLFIQNNGFAVFTDHSIAGEEWTRQFTQGKLKDIHALYEFSQFFMLKDEYVDKQVADAFFYSILYKQNGKKKIVTTNYFSAPKNLKLIVDDIWRTISIITDTGLLLELTLDQSVIHAGESVNMKLTVTNTDSQELNLHFATGQIFDFSVFGVNGGNRRNDELIWKWSHNKVFTLAAMDILLDAGESRSYEVTWDGTDNDGQPVDGKFAVRAELVSSPGGSTSLQDLTIMK